MEKFEYFICYSGKDLNLNKEGIGYGWNWEFANALYSDLIAFDKKVYFAPRNGLGDAYNNNETLSSLIQGLDAFIVLLTPNFVNEFNPKDEDNTIVKELDLALKEAKLNPKFIRFVQMPNFHWYVPFRTRLQERYSEEEYPFNKYFDISSYQCDPRRIPTERAKDFINTVLSINVRQTEALKDYKYEVGLCFHSMVAHKCELSISHNFQDEINRYGLHWSNPEKSYYWPVFFMEDGEQEESQSSHISTCSTCFGILQILHWDLVDSGQVISQQQNEFVKITNDYFKNICSDALSMLVAMRDADGRWPATKAFDAEGKTDYEQDRGLNQTTLCISTLLKSDFLSINGKYLTTNTPAILENRYEFITKSINWILDCNGAKDEKRAFWNADDEEKGPRIIGSVFLTAVCLDTFIKFMADEYVRAKNDETTQRVKNTFQKILAFFQGVQSYDGGIKIALQGAYTQPSFSHTAKVMNSLCALRDFAKTQEGDPVYAEIVTVSDVIISKCFAYLINMIENPKSPIYADDKTLMRDFRYELFIVPDDPVNADKVVEYYELNGELLAVTALTKILRDKEYYLPILNDFYKMEGKPEEDVEFRRRQLMNHLFGYFDGYRTRDNHVQKFFDKTAAESILIKSRRAKEEFHYPIYALYYYRMALTELLNLFEADESILNSSSEAVGDKAENCVDSRALNALKETA